jgi:hypothetical protein
MKRYALNALMNSFMPVWIELNALMSFTASQLMLIQSINELIRMPACFSQASKGQRDNPYDLLTSTKAGKKALQKVVNLPVVELNNVLVIKKNCGSPYIPDREQKARFSRKMLPPSLACDRPVMTNL